MAKLVYKRKNGKWEARYRKGMSPDGRVLYGTVYGDTEEEAIERRSELLRYNMEDINDTPEMNLIILGAGIHGHDVFEIAESLRIFKKISFLDDYLEGDSIIGKCSDVALFRKQYPCAFIAIGDNNVRKHYAELLKENKFLTPSLVSLSANVSPRAQIGEGVAILAQATVNEAVIGNFCIVDFNCLINSGAAIEHYSRIDCGAIVLRNVLIKENSWIKSGDIIEGNKS